MRFGLFVDSRKVTVVREFVDQHPQYNLEVVMVGMRNFVTCMDEYDSAVSPGAGEAIRKLINLLGHIHDVDKAISVLDLKANTHEDHIEHIQRLHRERAAPGAFLLRNLRSEGGLDHDFE